MKTLVLSFISLYQSLPLASHSACRFTPSCSHYSYQVILKYGILKGSFLSLKRIFHCHPGSLGGYDPTP